MDINRFDFDQHNNRIILHDGTVWSMMLQIRNHRIES